ncbi:IPT/TIG domain-containing protein [Pedobacter heparinus]|uniref:IPT/TIG domain-containing protein n=1 Tax=Pedobacter heparinus TaxID=984 RepID=UPI00292D614E|nr:IPT/TIG domain-containing protein [Pedobacter heparinus]
MRIFYIAAVFGLLLTACNKEEQAIPLNPVIKSIIPAQGPAKTIVSVRGKRFSPNPEENIVKFAGINARVVMATDTLLQVEAPEDGGTGNLTVSVKGRLSKGPVFSYGEIAIEYLNSTYAGAAAGDAVGTLEEARFRSPEGVIMDSKGNLIVADRGNNRIKMISPSGQVSVVAGSGVAGNIDGAADVAQFRNPYKIGIDKDDNIYVADNGNHRVRKIAAGTGLVTTIAGSSAGFLDGVGTAARFNGPIAIATDLNGNVYVADNNNHAIRKIAPNGLVTTIGGNGTTGYGDGVWPNVRFANPSGIAVDAEGNILVADRKNNRIRKITVSTGVVTTVAGNGLSKSVDGNGLKASFAEPFGITVDAKGNFYIADLTSHMVRIMRSTGDVVSIGGDGTAGYLDGGKTGSKYNQPTDAVADANGIIYVADLSNARIRKITPGNPL